MSYSEVNFVQEKKATPPSAIVLHLMILESQFSGEGTEEDKD